MMLPMGKRGAHAGLVGWHGMSKGIFAKKSGYTVPRDIKPVKQKWRWEFGRTMKGRAVAVINFEYLLSRGKGGLRTFAASFAVEF